MIKKILFLVAAMLLLSPVALSQHNGGGSHSGGGGASRGSMGSTHASAPRSNTSSTYRSTTRSSNSSRFSQPVQHQNAYRTPHVDIRDGRLRNDHYGRSFGREHEYRGRDFHWHGWPRERGSHFYIGGFWWGFYDPWPACWADEYSYYVVWDDAEGVYYMYSPMCEEYRLRVFVIF